MTVTELSEMELKVNKGVKLKHKIDFIKSKLNNMDKVIKSDVDQLDLVIGSYNDNEQFAFITDNSVKDMFGDILKNMALDIMLHFRELLKEELEGTKEELEKL